MGMELNPAPWQDAKSAADVEELSKNILDNFPPFEPAYGPLTDAVPGDEGLEENGNASAAPPVGPVTMDIPAKPTVLTVGGDENQCALNEKLLLVELSELHERPDKDWLEVTFSDVVVDVASEGRHWGDNT